MDPCLYDLTIQRACTMSCTHTCTCVSNVACCTHACAFGVGGFGGEKEGKSLT